MHAAHMATALLLGTSMQGFVCRSPSSMGLQNTAGKVAAVLQSPRLQRSVVPLAVSGALLGPNLDNYHSAFGVLQYAHPLQLAVNDHVLVTTDWWVPPLFSVAAVGIGALYVIFDELLNTPAAARKPSWPAVLTCISLFSAQYYISGALHAAGVATPELALALALPMALGFAVFDGTLAGAVVSLLTAVLGPAIELALINIGHLYTYTGADFYGVDSWIPLVYFLGGPAVGNLSRAYFAALSETPDEA
jgi:hypothetical protein